MRPAERIADLIFAYLRDELSPEQEQELSEWRRLTPENEDFFRQETDPENIRMAITELYEDKDIVWQKIRDKVPGLPVVPDDDDEATPSRRPVPYWMISIAAILVLSLAFSMYFLLRHTGENQNKTEAIALKAPAIVPGGNHAFLILGDGSAIKLDSTPNGIVGVQNGRPIEKKASGEIVYAPGSQAAAGNRAYNILKTPRGGQYAVVLSDGTKVWLNAASSLKYPASFSGSERTVELEGEAYFEVAGKKDAPFHVKVNGKPEILVLGTRFNIMAYPDEPYMSTTLVDGSVKTGSKILKPGQQAQAADSQSVVLVLYDVDVASITAWKNGKTSFENASIQEIMRAISRWYDVDIQYKGKIPDKRFKGGLPRNTDLAVLLNVLAQNGIHFTVDGKQITVTP